MEMMRHLTTASLSTMATVLSLPNGIPDHDAENDAVSANPNTRCER